jgi:hypothetical protein
VAPVCRVAQKAADVGALHCAQELPFDKNDDEISTDERFSKLRQARML